MTNARKVKDALIEQPFIRNREIAEATGLTIKQVDGAIVGLVRQDILFKVRDETRRKKTFLYAMARGALAVDIWPIRDSYPEWVWGQG